MKIKALFIILILQTFGSSLLANTPTTSLETAVNELIGIASNANLSSDQKRAGLEKILLREVDLEAMSRRVVSKHWKNATDAQKDEFKSQFLQIIVNTYASLLDSYNNEKVVFESEDIKKDRYATVDTHIAASDKKIPVRYRMIKHNNAWKIYDFIPEGISIVSNYKNNYASILSKDGMDALLVEMKKKAEEKSDEAN